MKTLFEQLVSLRERIGRPLRVACDWDEVIFLTEYFCYSRAIKERPSSIPESIRQLFDEIRETKEYSKYPHGGYWNDIKDREIFFREDLFKNPGVLDGYDAMIQGVEEGIIKELVFMTFSPKLNNQLDDRKKKIFKNYFGRFDNRRVSMVIIPFQPYKDEAFEKGEMIGHVFKDCDILIDNHLNFVLWTASLSNVSYFLVPYYNQRQSAELNNLLSLSNKEIIYYPVRLSKLLTSFEY